MFSLSLSLVRIYAYVLYAHVLALAYIQGHVYCAHSIGNLSQFGCVVSLTNLLNSDVA